MRTGCSVCLHPSDTKSILPPSPRTPNDPNERLFVAYLLGFEDGCSGKDPEIVRILVRDGLEASVWREGFTKGTAARDRATADASTLSGFQGE